RNFALELDVQQTVVQFGAHHKHVIGQLEGMLEITRRDTAMQEVARTLFGLLAAGDFQRVALGFNVDFFTGKARNRHRDPVLVLAHQLDVVRRVARLRITLRIIEQLGQTIEANGGTIKRGKVKSTHGYILSIQAIKSVGPLMSIRCFGYKAGPCIFKTLFYRPSGKRITTCFIASCASAPKPRWLFKLLYTKPVA